MKKELVEYSWDESTHNASFTYENSYTGEITMNTRPAKVYSPEPDQAKYFQELQFHLATQL